MQDLSNAPSLLRRRLLQAAAGLSLGGLLPAARACEFYTTTLRVTHPWTRVTAAGADWAAVCMRFDEVQQDDRLIGVETPVARHAALGGEMASSVIDFAIPAGRETLLSEDGTWLRLSGLNHPLEQARAYPLTLIFALGGRVQADLSVDYDALPGAHADHPHGEHEHEGR